jgi:hypothetical protein
LRIRKGRTLAVFRNSEEKLGIAKLACAGKHVAEPIAAGSFIRAICMRHAKSTKAERRSPIIAKFVFNQLARSRGFERKSLLNSISAGQLSGAANLAL